ncbi:MAG: TldD/PmbA family protein [Thermoplasmata archaeon]
MLDKCNRFAKKALRLGAEEAEICILERRGIECTIETNRVKLVSAGSSVGLALRVLKGDRLGFSFTTKLDDIEGLVRKALSMSRLGKRVRDFRFPSGEKTRKVQKTFDKRLADLPPEYGHRGCLEMIEGALEVDKEINLPRGRTRYGVETLSMSNSRGLEAEDKVTYFYAGVDTVLKRNGVSTGAESYCSKLMDADFTEIGRKAAQWALDTSGPKRIQGGRMSVLFCPLAVRDMLEFILVPALYADRSRKGESFLSDKLGEVVTSEKISFYDEPRMPNGPNSGAIDDEGTPSSRTDLITRGELKSFLYDAITASEYGERSTSNAIRAGRLSNERKFNFPPRISARNFVLRGPGKGREDLLAETEDGILVHGVLGAHTSNPASGDFSVSSPRLLRIEKGEIVHPVSSAMISGNLLDLLGRVSGVADDTRAMRGSIGVLGVVAPTVRFEDVQVTG